MVPGEQTQFSAGIKSCQLPLITNFLLVIVSFVQVTMRRVDGFVRTVTISDSTYVSTYVNKILDTGMFQWYSFN